MPHIPLKDRNNWAFWITGTPGSGLTTIGQKFNGFYTDNIGYRTSHELHREWIVDPNILKYKITNPEEQNPCFYGFGQNFVELSYLPWKLIIIMRVSENVLIDRVTQYRVRENIQDGEEHNVVAHKLFLLQEGMIKILKRTKNKVFVVDSDSDSYDISLSIVNIINNFDKLI